jgi:hypothetical protein
MKSIFRDSIAMGLVALLLFIYLGIGLESILVFIVGLTGIRQARRYGSKRLSEQKKKAMEERNSDKIS